MVLRGTVPLSSCVALCRLLERPTGLGVELPAMLDKGGAKGQFMLVAISPGAGSQTATDMGWGDHG